MAEALTELFGRLLGIGSDFQLTSHGIDITPVCTDATITVSAEGAETANTRNITIQFLKADGTDMDAPVTAEVIMYLDATGTNHVVTGGSTGITGGAGNAGAGVDGSLLAIVAKKRFSVISEADGDLDLEWLDTGTEAAYLGLKLPSGRIIISDALTNA